MTHSVVVTSPLKTVAGSIPALTVIYTGDGEIYRRRVGGELTRHEDLPPPTATVSKVPMSQST